MFTDEVIPIDPSVFSLKSYSFVNQGTVVKEHKLITLAEIEDERWENVRY